MRSTLFWVSTLASIVATLSAQPSVWGQRGGIGWSANAFLVLARRQQPQRLTAHNICDRHNFENARSGSDLRCFTEPRCSIQSQRHTLVNVFLTPATTLDLVPEEVTSATLTAETRWISQHLTVVDPMALLVATFGKDVVNSTRRRASGLKGVFKARKKKPWVVEKHMYAPVTAAFNDCCNQRRPSTNTNEYASQRPLRCVNIATKEYSLAPEVAFNTKIGPDLCLTFDHDGIKSSTPCDYSNVLIELKVSSNVDISMSSTSAKKELSKERIELLQQIYGYVAYGQWPALPYRFSCTITICNDKLRLWRWTSTGVVVTDPIDYLEDATVVAQFVQIVGSGPHSRLGLDIGHGMTFSSIANAEETNKMRVAIRAYFEAGSKTESQKRWYKKAQAALVLRFQSESLSFGNGPVQALVVSHPISWTLGVFGRSTRVFLSSHAEDVEMHDMTSLEHIHILKIGWQYTTRTPELQFFTMAAERNGDQAIPHLATVLSGGEILSTTQKLGLFLEKPPKPAQDGRWSGHINDHELFKYQSIPDADLLEDPLRVVGTHPRVLQWILFREVGGPLGGFGSIKTLLSAMLDAITAHRSLRDIDILHRDISEGNVLIDLNTGGGLLIDLDMAEDLTPNITNPPQRLAITGTRRFMSVAMQERPNHTEWHDLESFFWLLLYMILKHAPGACLLDGDGNMVERMAGLETVFPDCLPHPNPLSDSIRAKREFLELGMVRATPKGLRNLADRLRTAFNRLHFPLKLAKRFRTDLQSLEEFFDPKDYPSFVNFRSVYSIRDVDDFVHYHKDCEAVLNKLQNSSIPDTPETSLYSLDLEDQGTAVSRLSDCFPDYDYVLKEFKDAYQEVSESGDASQAIDHELLIDKARAVGKSKASSSISAPKQKKNSRSEDSILSSNSKDSIPPQSPLPDARSLASMSTSLMGVIQEEIISTSPHEPSRVHPQKSDKRRSARIEAAVKKTSEGKVVPEAASTSKGKGGGRTKGSSNNK